MVQAYCIIEFHCFHNVSAYLGHRIIDLLMEKVLKYRPLYVLCQFYTALCIKIGNLQKISHIDIFNAY